MMSDDSFLSKPVIRDACAEDAEAILAIDRACFAEPDSLETVKAQLSDSSVAVKLCELDGTIVSYCSALSVLDEVQIINVATLPKYTSNGYAYKVLCSLLDDAKARGAISASLEVRVSNAAAIHVYEKAGFVNCGIRRGFYKKPAEDALVMVARISEGVEIFYRKGQM